MNFTRKHLPIESFNHIAREVADIEESLQFYRDIMGFVVIPRPPFEVEGYWLWGYGMALHIVISRIPREKRESDLLRIEYLKQLLPRVDHMAFISRNIDYIKETLVERGIFFHEDFPLGPEGRLRQLFFFDPDGNVLEISNCGPEVGKIFCNEDTVV